MNLKTKDLIGLPVFTQSNQALGKICDFELDPTIQKITKYYVKSGKLIKELLAKELIISSEQVISIDKEKMIVEDNVKKEKSPVYEVPAVSV